MSQTAQTLAAIYNEKRGGVKIGEDVYKIEVVSVDDKMDPKTAITGAERLIQQEGIRYILGPNVDTTAVSIKPVLEANKALNVPYAFSKELYVPPASNSILGMVASYQLDFVHSTPHTQERPPRGSICGAEFLYCLGAAGT